LKTLNNIHAPTPSATGFNSSAFQDAPPSASIFFTEYFEVISVLAFCTAGSGGGGGGPPTLMPVKICTQFRMAASIVVTTISLRVGVAKIPTKTEFIHYHLTTGARVQGQWGWHCPLVSHYATMETPCERWTLAPGNWDQRVTGVQPFSAIFDLPFGQESTPGFT
jgi:hypothetical protein